MRLPLVLALVSLTALPCLAQEQPQTLSLLGDPLYAPPVPPETREKLESETDAALATLKKDPGNVDAAVALSRGDMGLGHVGDALEALTRAREVKPDDPRLQLESARDLIVNRKFDAAERDARKAADTLSEANCVIGFARYLKADYAHAKEAYATCADPGMFLYLADRYGHGSSVPRPVITDQPKASSQPLRFPGSTAKAGKPEKSVAAAYLEAAERLAAGKKKDARDLLKPIVEKHMNEWMTPAYIAAEADYSRIAKRAPTGRRK